jgi:hypothetical protein
MISQLFKTHSELSKKRIKVVLPKLSQEVPDVSKVKELFLVNVLPKEGRQTEGAKILLIEKLLEIQNLLPSVLSTRNLMEMEHAQTALSTNFRINLIQQIVLLTHFVDQKMDGFHRFWMMVK